MEKQEKFDGEIEIDLMQIIKLLVSKLPIIIAAAVVMGALAFVGTKLLITPLYQSTAKLYVINRQNDSNTTLSDIQVSTQIVKDYQVLVKSIPVVDQVIANLGLDMTQDALIGKISCSIATDSRVLSLTITDPDPVLAKKIVDELADVSKVQIPSIMRIEGVEIIEYGRVPGGASSPNTTMNTLIGAVLGMLIVVAIVVIRFIVDDTVKNSEDVEKYLGLSTLALIPITEEEYDGHSSKKKKFSLFGKRG